MLVALLVALVAAPVPESRGAVVVLRPARASARLLEASTRLGAELRASGFAVSEQERTRDRRVLAYEAGAFMALRPRPLAAISVFEADGELAAALWRVDAPSGKPMAWRVTVRDDSGADPGEARAPSVLAIRAVELLHASLTGVELDAPKLFPPPPPPPAPAPPPPTTTVTGPAPAAPPPAPPAATFVTQGITASAGVGVLHALGGLGTSAAPALRLGHGWRQGLWARLGFVGLGSTARVSGPGGSATSRQDTLLLDLVRTFRAGAWLEPYVGGGLGATLVRVVGEPDPGYVRRSASFWAGVAHGAGGVGLRLGARTALVLEAAALLAAPPLKVRLVGEDVGTSGKPSLLATLALQAGL